jgi:hypothetical protein
MDPAQNQNQHSTSGRHLPMPAPGFGIKTGEFLAESPAGSAVSDQACRFDCKRQRKVSE